MGIHIYIYIYICIYISHNDLALGVTSSYLWLLASRLVSEPLASSTPASSLPASSLKLEQMQTGGRNEGVSTVAVFVNL